jgi:hypothetical protein
MRSLMLPAFLFSSAFGGHVRGRGHSSYCCRSGVDDEGARKGSGKAGEAHVASAKKVSIELL